MSLKQAGFGFAALAALAAGSGCVETSLQGQLEALTTTIDGVTFTTATEIPQNPPPNVSVTVTEATRAQAIYAETIALPVFPPGVYSCPEDPGVTYNLDFYSGGALVASAVLDPNGCETVEVSRGTSSEALRWSFSDSYWSTLAANLQIPESEIFPYDPPGFSD